MILLLYIGWVCSCMACLHNITISVYSFVLPLLDISKNDMDKKHCTCSDSFRGISVLTVYLGKNMYIFDIFSRVTGSLLSKYIPQKSCVEESPFCLNWEPCPSSTSKNVNDSVTPIAEKEIRFFFHWWISGGSPWSYDM